jgi:hypothetical protein
MGYNGLRAYTCIKNCMHLLGESLSKLHWTVFEVAQLLVPHAAWNLGLREFAGILSANTSLDIFMAVSV